MKSAYFKNANCWYWRLYRFVLKQVGFMVLPNNYILNHNGVPVKWFIGDYNFRSGYWEAWGSANGHAYQMFAKFNQHTRILSELKIFDDRTNPYFHEETYKLLTK